MGSYDDFETAERDAKARALLDGNVWEVITVPRNALYPNDVVRGSQYVSFNAADCVSTQDHIEFEAVIISEVQRLRTAARQLGEILHRRPVV